jgi:PadR family transcriptional regulator PadR
MPRTPQPLFLLGDIEQRVLLAIFRLGPDASGVPIVAALRRHARRPVLLPSVYLALRRLEAKGLIRSRLGEPEARRGGRARRYFALEAAGKAALRDAQRSVLRLWRGVSLDES